MSLPIKISMTHSDANDDGIAETQALAAAGNLTLNGADVSNGVATICPYGTERAVILTSGGNDTGITFTVYGLNASGNPVQQTVTGTNGSTVTTTRLFHKVTRIYASGQVATTIKAGTTAVMSSRWVALNTNLTPFNVGLAVNITGTINYTVQTTYDNILETTAASPTSPELPIIPFAWSVSDLASKNADLQSSLTTPVMAVRIVLNSGTSSPTADFYIAQAGISSP